MGLLQPWHLLVIVFLMGIAAVIVIVIVAATRGTRPPAPPIYPPTYPPHLPQPPGTDPTATLAHAKSMLDQGLISQAEYDEMKRTVLARMQR